MSPQLQNIEYEFEKDGGYWKEVAFEDFFKPVQRGDIQNQNSLSEDNEGIVFVAQNDSNNGFVKRVLNKGYKEFKKNSIIIGRQTGVVYFQSEDFITTDGVLILRPKKCDLNKITGLFITTILRKQLSQFGYTNTVSAKKLSELSLPLPYKENNIDYIYIEKFIRALEAESIETLESYLTVTGLKNYELTKEENEVLKTFNNLINVDSEASESLRFVSISMEKVFTHIKQGRRLKKGDQVVGDLPFVMAGTTNTGIVGKIANKVEVFPRNSITIDIFGNTFYRGYEFGAGDDTGVFWNELLTDKLALLYLQTAIGKALGGKYDFGHKLRASQTHKLELLLPCLNDEPDYKFMRRFIRVVEKLVVHDLVEWTYKKLKTTREVVERK
ncbi:hypothetical protein P7D85_02415 [Enterococcus hulanensis]|uniref:Restriction endonuclease subunit S n=1 Tax=Enterococcus hulanensis TaxID=2559929 RepID=A0ABU3EUQ8_9ENTE|nr:hypothetical protein [Enterococcus hulanensis]MDT2598609.1 hypothetical protein [Enterococcus hulanensis]MDT2607886.1 hypothetical protein [Enterococcus hulanensis]MDT2615181.1 hypothetical protein [Enterococcus hulanensis]MDT2626848.1 hypothetical protein [Enterococcus hulanensis]MDT2654253.1 hypothetical protein [Enterococcus hulanensis]